MRRVGELRSHPGKRPLCACGHAATRHFDLTGPCSLRVVCKCHKFRWPPEESPVMTTDEMRTLLAEALWRIDTGGESPPLSQASSSSHRVYLRAATDLLPTIRSIAAAELREAASEVMREHGTASLAAKSIRTRCIDLDAS